MCYRRENLTYDDTLIGVHFQVKFGEEKLAQVEKSDVYVSTAGMFPVRRDGAKMYPEGRTS